jgi:hypothetical protein
MHAATPSLPYRQIANALGATESIVGKVLRGERWRHVR